MTVRFVSGQILFRGGSVAMSEDCCCGDPCNCLLIGPRITPCYNCLATDYPATEMDFGTVPDFLVDISGVASGVATTPGSGAGCFFFSPCETTVASNVGMFNAVHVVPPCSSVIVSECHYMGCEASGAGAGFPSSRLYARENNYLNLTHEIRNDGFGRPSKHRITVAMASSTSLVLLPPGATEAEICAGAAFFGSSTRGRTIILEGDAGLRPSWRYDPSDCTEECNETIYQMACVASGWSLSTTISDTSTSTACQHALTFGGAAIAAEAS